MRFWVIVDHQRPDVEDPWSVFRSADGRPPFELWNPDTGGWDDEAELVSFFTGDEYGAVEVTPAAAAKVVERKLAESDAA